MNSANIPCALTLVVYQWSACNHRIPDPRVWDVLACTDPLCLPHEGWIVQYFMYTQVKTYIYDKSSHMKVDVLLRKRVQFAGGDTLYNTMNH